MDFLNRLSLYGADTQGTMERLLGDKEFYRECVYGFLEDENFLQLSEAVSAQNYEKAFENAHALKGVSANLGLTPLYASICELVESLRAGDSSKAVPQLNRIAGEKCRLERALKEEVGE